ncbi:DNA-binding transcriptional regulator, IclR family [Actinopolymorpha cephalotaxi]|uniref:DNA-binding IclR family transcriptional regulator n=1 Tax=Actinopolymorpha cephalotaxi TaxID=504797 RepID=A0A1I2S4A5_9ACTN|nr:IclR family transcriptional regulator [Actinopolymorpha cephalotaxi]NYH83816.1 DNA-binding IclR family transcriptional regulator [Actinopolymorpha cephalotaxi]SFG44886.1 DNA-binding transcriptional regulator, IclR family [Actinopolymorpha cephalotaxi]
MGAEPNPRAASPSTDRALRVLETLVQAESSLTLTMLAQEAGVPLATCASIVQTFEERGYANRQVVGRSHFWQPTLRLYAMATRLVRKIDPTNVSRQHLRSLSDKVGMPAHLGALDGATIVYVAKAATPGFVQFDTFVGKVAPFNLTALGRAIAAYLPESELVSLLDHLAPGAGPRARRPSVRAFRRELAETRERGYAFEDEEEQAEISCVAAPVFDAGDRVAYAVGVTGFSSEFSGAKLHTVAAAVRQTASAISSELGSLVPPQRTLT